jgi:hypothetical protein
MKSKIFEGIKILVFIILIGALWNECKTETQPIPEKTIIIPPIEGKTDTIYIEKVVLQKIYIPTKGVIVVDSTYKDKYDTALKERDSARAVNLYYDAITVRDTTLTLVDNDTISIKVSTKTRGWLLSQSSEYFIKETSFSYKPEVVKTLPRLSLGLGLEVGIGRNIDSGLVTKANFSIQTGKGHNFSIGYDSNNTKWIGYRRSFTIFK